MTASPTTAVRSLYEALGGRLDRNRIRVASIGGKRGTGVGRAEWEQTYYSDVLAARAWQTA